MTIKGITQNNCPYVELRKDGIKYLIQKSPRYNWCSYINTQVVESGMTKPQADKWLQSMERL